MGGYFLAPCISFKRKRVYTLYSLRGGGGDLLSKPPPQKKKDSCQCFTSKKHLQVLLSQKSLLSDFGLGLATKANSYYSTEINFPTYYGNF